MLQFQHAGSRLDARHSRNVHDFHFAWIAELRRVLNGGLLPEGYYALAEQVAGGVTPDVLTLQEREPDENEVQGEEQSGDKGGLAVAAAPPRVALSETLEDAGIYSVRRRRVVIRHTTGDRIVALIEIVSPGNKERQPALKAFIDKAAAAIEAGFHLLVIDLLPPGFLDPQGIHGIFWNALAGDYHPPAGRPLTLAAYALGQTMSGAVTCYVEPCAVGDALIPMPLFLDPEHYINVPLEPTYMAAYEGVPRRWKRVIEGTG